MLQVIEPKMTPEQFIYWLQGFSELHGKEPTASQWLEIKKHLAKVITHKENPSYGFGTGTSAFPQYPSTSDGTFIC